MPKRTITLGEIHYKNVKLLRSFLTPAGSILPRAKTGLNARQQRKMSREMKRARHLALLPYTAMV